MGSSGRLIVAVGGTLCVRLVTSWVLWFVLVGWGMGDGEVLGLCVGLVGVSLWPYSGSLGCQAGGPLGAHHRALPLDIQY